MNLTNFHLSRTVVIMVVTAMAVIIAIAYLLSREPSVDSTVTVDGVPTSETEATFITLVGQLDTIVFNTAVLSDLRFTSLQDIHTAIVPEAQGRTDPFAPLSGTRAR